MVLTWIVKLWLLLIPSSIFPAALGTWKRCIFEEIMSLCFCVWNSRLVYMNHNLFYLYNINIIPKITAAQQQSWNNWDRWQTRLQIRKDSGSFCLHCLKQAKQRTLHMGLWASHSKKLTPDLFFVWSANLLLHGNPLRILKSNDEDKKRKTRAIYVSHISGNNNNNIY